MNLSSRLKKLEANHRPWRCPTCALHTCQIRWEDEPEQPEKPCPTCGRTPSEVARAEGWTYTRIRVTYGG